MKPETYANISILSMLVFITCSLYFFLGWQVAPDGSRFGEFYFLGVTAALAAVVGFATQFLAIRGFKREDVNKV